jgi:hypothetical protein
MSLPLPLPLLLLLHGVSLLHRPARRARRAWGSRRARSATRWAHGWASWARSRWAPWLLEEGHELAGGLWVSTLVWGTTRATCTGTHRASHKMSHIVLCLHSCSCTQCHIQSHKRSSSQA